MALLVAVAACLGAGAAGAAPKPNYSLEGEWIKHDRSVYEVFHIKCVLPEGPTEWRVHATA